MRRPVTGEVHVHYGQIYVESDPDDPTTDFSEAFAGQSGGLCGAAVPGALWMTTGLHTGDVGFCVEVHDEAPALDPAWEDVVEVSFRPLSEGSCLIEWGGGAAWHLGLAVTDYRVRYCARGMDEGQKRDTRMEGEPQKDSYLLQFWPAPPAQDRVVRQTAEAAAYWHRYARELPSPPTPEERAEAERHAREAEERAAEERRSHHEQWIWGGRLPSERLRGLRCNVRGLLAFDSDLVHTLDAASPEVQHAVALLAARRACEAAGLAEVPWVADALTAVAGGRPLPSPFDDVALMWETLRSDPRVPRHRSVLRAVPPERAPYRPPAQPAAPGATWVPVVEPEAPGPRRPGLGRHLGTMTLMVSPGEGPRSAAVPADVRPGNMMHGTGTVMHAEAAMNATGVVTRGTGAVPDSATTPRDPRRISPPHFAPPAVLAAAGADPLKAALDAVWHAVATYGEHYPSLLEEIRSACAVEAGE